MRILGICHDVYICSAAVVDDGVVVSAIAEERLDRRKRSSVFPEQAVGRCLDEAGISIRDVDEIAVAWNPSIDIQTLPDGYLSARRWRSEHLMQVPARIARLAGEGPSDELTVIGSSSSTPPITFVDHYAAHLGSGFATSAADPAAFLVMDGRGETLTSQFGVVEGAERKVLGEVQFPHSLGLFYGAVTQYLGFKPDSDEWKVMALASYAEPENGFTDRVRKLIDVDDDGTFRLALEYFEHYNFFDRRLFSDRFVGEFGAPRAPGDPIEPAHEELAAAMQTVFEDVVAKIATITHERTGLDHLIASGGCFMNSVFNGKATELTPFHEVSVSSCPDDSGTSIGAALFLHTRRTGSRPPVSTHNYWGPGFTDEQCLDVAHRYKLAGAAVVADPSAAAAQDLVDGRIVGWFQGRMEFGQRALGNRSILLDPRREDGRDVVNAAVKFREAFRPFAPAILAERVTDFFECPEGSRVPYMERVFPFVPSARARVPSVVHVDGSGRLQTVERPDNLRFYDLIARFDELTGIPIVLNTSFNLNGEPIVCTPDDAIRTFSTCGLDVLYLGNVRIAK
ncbi:MAG TPA: carbamoyltransferase C-terminal domain-containing protein [Actinomycetota bacterium]